MRAHVPPRRTLLACLLALAAWSAVAAAAPADRPAPRHRAHVCRVLHERLVHHPPRHPQRLRTRVARCRRAAHRAHLRRAAHRRQAARLRRLARARRERARRRVAIAPSGSAHVTTTVHGTARGWNGFGPGSWPGAGWRPYADDSPFNRLVAGAPLHPASARIVQRVLSWGEPGNLIAGSADSDRDYAHPTYYSQPGDPLYTLHSTGYSPDVEGLRIPVPDAARPAGGDDAHMTIVTPDGWEYDLWQVRSKPAGGGTLTFSIGGRTRIDGDGLDSNATAARYGNLAGVIRAQELAAGQIDHALFVVVKCTSSGTSFGFGTQPGPGDQSAFVYPASHGGSRCDAAESADAPPMGARFELAMSDAQIAALAVPAWKKAILRALAHYGGYVGDTGGPGFALQFESSTMYTSFGYADPLVQIAQQNGIAPWDGLYAFNLADGVDWARYLRVVTPPAR